MARYLWLMTPEVVAALLGAGLAGFAALAVQLTGAWTTRSASKKADRATRLGEFLAATHSVVLSIGRLARLESGHAEMEKDGYRSGPEYNGREDRVNSMFNAIQLLDPEAVVFAAIELDWCLIALEREAMKKCWDSQGWHQRRTEILGASVDRLMSAGRASLGRGPLDRARLFESARSRLVERDQRFALDGSLPPES